MKHGLINIWLEEFLNIGKKAWNLDNEIDLIVNDIKEFVNCESQVSKYALFNGWIFSLYYVLIRSAGSSKKSNPYLKLSYGQILWLFQSMILFYRKDDQTNKDRLVEFSGKYPKNKSDDIAERMLLGNRSTPKFSNFRLLTSKLLHKMGLLTSEFKWIENEANFEKLNKKMNKSWNKGFIPRFNLILNMRKTLFEDAYKDDCDPIKLFNCFNNFSLYLKTKS